MDRTAEVYKDALSCPVCMETFTTPKMLPCGHSFCLPCLAEIVKELDPICPLCRTPISLPPSGKIEDIPTNFSVKDLLEVVEKTGTEKKRDKEDTKNSVIPCHGNGWGDYVCSTCLEQVCSNCQLSLHIDSDHTCTSVSDFTEKIQQDVSKMLTIINDLSCSEESKRYTASSSIMPTYVNLQEMIRTACYEILQLLCEDKLDLTRLKLLQKQVKKDHGNFTEAWCALKKDICFAKKREVLKSQFAKYRQTLMTLKLPESLNKNRYFGTKISSFGNLKRKTEALNESLTQRSETDSFDIREMEEKLLVMRENIGVMEQYIKDVTPDYHIFLLRKIGVTGSSVKPHHLFRILEEVDVTQFSSSRHSNDVMFKCHELVNNFLASREVIRTLCTTLFQKFHNGSLQLFIVKERLAEISKQLEQCKEYNEAIYKIIGRTFVKYDNSWTKECIKRYLLSLDTYVLESSSRERTPFMEQHLKEFERFKETTKSLCKSLMRDLSGKNLSTDVVHGKLKAIEIRIEKTEYHLKLLKIILSMETRCREITEEFQKIQVNEQTVIPNFMWCGHKEEVQSIWKQILQHYSSSILFDVQVIRMFSEAMEERRNTVVSLLMLSFSQLNDLGEKMSKLVQVMSLRARLIATVEEISNNLPASYNRHRQRLKDLHVISEIADADPMTKLLCVKKYSLQQLLLLVNQRRALNNLYREIPSAFQAECVCSFQIASKAGDKLMRLVSNWLTLLAIPERERDEWNVLVQENNHQWRKVADIVRTEDIDMQVFESRLDKALSLYYEINSVSNKIYVQYVKVGLHVFRFLALCTVLLVILYFLTS